MHFHHLLFSRPSGRLRPTPDLADPSGHMDFLLHDLNNPGMGEHILGSGPCQCIDRQSVVQRKGAK